MASLVEKAKLLRLQLDKTLLALFTAPLAVLLLFFVAPLASIFIGLTGFDWSTLASPFFFNPNPLGSPIVVREVAGKTVIIVQGVNLGVILNSIVNAAIVTLVATAMGTATALLVGLYDFPGRRVLAAMAAIPLLVAPFVNAYVTRLLYGVNLQGNLVSRVLEALGIPVEIGFKDLAGIALAQILAFYPIVYVNVLAALNAVDASLIEQALNLGSRGFRLVRTIVLPLVMPGILAGATLVYILSLEDVGAPIVFNYRNVMSYQVYMFFREYTAIGATGVAAALSLIILGLAVAPLIFTRRYLSLKYYARLARGAPRPLQRLKLGLVGRLAAYLIVFPFVLAAAAPQVGILVLAFSERWVGGFPTGFTLNNYMVLFGWEGVVRGIVNSAFYASMAALLIALLGFASGYTVARLRLKGVGLLDMLSTAPLAVPGLVVAFGYFIFFTSIARGTILDPLVTPVAVLIIAYTVRKMPFTVRSTYTGVIQTPREMEEAAKSLSAPTHRVLSGIVLPLTWRSVVAGLLLSTIYVLSEVSVSVTIGALGGDIMDPNHAGPITFVIMRLIETPSVIGGAQPQAVAAAMATILMAIEAFVIFLALGRLARGGRMMIGM